MEELIKVLQTQQANAVIGALNHWACHWAVKGSLFVQLHEFFGDLYEQTLGLVDELAERCRELGAMPILAPDVYPSAATIKLYSDESKPGEMVTLSVANVEQVISELQDGIVLAQSIGEWGVADLLTKDVQVYQKQLWMLKMLLEN